MAESSEKLEVGDWRQFTIQDQADRWLRALRDSGYDGVVEDQGAQLYRFRVTITVSPHGPQEGERG